MADLNYIEDVLRDLAVSDLRRKCVLIESAQDTVVRIAGDEKILFCSNNYLSLAADKRIVESVVDAVRRYGHGAAASRLISGTMLPHVELEQRFAKFFGKEAALIFPSGWTANEAVITTLAGKGDLLLLDKLDHASIIDAARSSGADFRTYRRGNLSRLEKILAQSNHKHRFIITESIFSMDGDTADLAELIKLKDKYGAFLIVDEAHSLGCLGPTGAGLAQQLGVLEKVDIVTATMSKAAGSAGGVVAARKPVIDLLINKARAFIYTTAPSIANCAAAMAAIDIFEEDASRRLALQENSRYLRTRLAQLGLDIGQSTTHIIPVIIGSQTQALEAARNLFEMGYFVVAIRPPTVSPGTSRLRISVQSGHSKEQIDGLCDALEKLIRQGLLPA